ncbi:hypothetical protein CR513_63055, partial [Mucuna pruriens]
MAEAICQCGPWSIKVSPCLRGKSVDWQPTDREGPFFYFYETLPLKLGMKLPFTHFERSVSHALNVAPNQLHLNGWAFVRAFELLYEDMGRVPSLDVFFYLPNREGRMDFSQKSSQTEDRFFRVTPSNVGPNLLVDNAGKPFFPLYWTQQFVVSISVGKGNLKEWENECIEELGSVPTLSSVSLIKGTALRNLKKWAQTATSNEVKPTAPIPLSTAQPKAFIDRQRTLVAPVVVLDSPVASDSNHEVSEKRTTEDDCGDQECPKKRAVGTGIKDQTLGVDEEVALRVGVWARSYPLIRVVDQNLATVFGSYKDKQLGVADSFRALQSGVRTLRGSNQSLVDKNTKASEANLKLSASLLEAEGKREVETTRDYLQAKLEVLRKDKRELEMAKLALEEKLSSVEEKLSFAELALTQAQVESLAKDRTIQSKEHALA